MSPNGATDSDAGELEERHLAMTSTMGSLLAQAGLWHLAANERGLDLPFVRGGAYFAHGGTTYDRKRNDDKDEFYDAVQQVVSGAAAIVQEHFDRRFWICPSHATVVLPAIVVKTPLFYSYLKPGAPQLEVEEIPRCRLAWSGSKAWPLVPNLDIVHVDALDQFVQERAREAAILLELLTPAIQDVAHVMRGQNLGELHVPKDWKHPQRLPYLLAKGNHFRNPDWTPQP
jgi:hypothetical protein